MADRITRDLADRIVAEAVTWLRTPYHHMAANKGHGVDCAMLPLCVYKAVGLVPADVDPRPYTPDWYMHRSEEIYLGWVTQFADRVEVGERGDFAMYRVGRTASHGAIIVDDELMIHASRPARQVEYTERRSLEHCLDSVWRVRT